MIIAYKLAIAIISILEFAGAGGGGSSANTEVALFIKKNKEVSIKETKTMQAILFVRKFLLICTLQKT